MTGETAPCASPDLYPMCTFDIRVSFANDRLRSGDFVFCLVDVTSFIFMEEGQFILTWDFRGFLLSSADHVGLGPKLKKGIVVGGTWESSLQ